LIETYSQFRHFIQLYDDENPEIKKIVQDILIKDSSEIIFNGSLEKPYLKKELRKRYSKILRELHFDLVYNAFKQQFSSRLEDLDLEESVLLLAYWNNPAINLKKLRLKLDNWAGEIGHKISLHNEPAANITALNNYLFQQQGLTGNSSDYYHPDNTFLDRILDSGLGIPISLSVVYLLISWRLGLPVYGIPLPAHFIVKYDDGAREYFIDPFYGGEQYSRSECINYIESHENLNPLKILRGCNNFEIIVRMLRNLQLVYSSYLDTPEKERQISSLIHLVESFYV
jgi:regulator of sirC expression with transglutaminase-like and TPR domain